MKYKTPLSSIMALGLFCFGLNAQYEIKIPEGYSPQVGAMVSMMEDIKKRITADVSELSQEQVLLALGSPSTTGQFGNEVFYYISQKRAKTYEFQKMKLIDQRILSVYFDEERQVSRVANCGMQDGRVFDFVTRTTPTGGEDFTFLKQILTGKATPASVLGPTRRDGGAPGF